MIRARRGMTLMELVAGIVVTGAMAALGAAAFGSIIDHRRVIIESTIETERAAALREMLRTWIGAATIQIQTSGPQGRTSMTMISPSGVSRTTTGPISGSRGAGAQASLSSQTTTIASAVTTGDELAFYTDALTPAMSRNVRIRLYVDGDPNTLEQGLSIEFQNTAQSPLQRMQLDSSIVMMTVEFLDQRTGRWYPYAEAATITPRAARIWFPPVENVYVPRILQYPLLFAIAPAVQAQQAGGGGRGGGQ